MKRKSGIILAGLFAALAAAGIYSTNYTGEDIVVIKPCITETGEVSQDTFRLAETKDIKVHAYKKYRDRDINRNLKLVIHHSAGSKDATIADLSKIHVDENGWAKLSYHFAVNYKGHVLFINDLDKLTYHVKGSNTISIGILMIGSYNLYEPSDELLDTLEIIIDYLKSQLDIDEVSIHNRMPGAETLCPGVYAEKKLEERNIIARRLKNIEL